MDTDDMFEVVIIKLKLCTSDEWLDYHNQDLSKSKELHDKEIGEAIKP